MNSSFHNCIASRWKKYFYAYVYLFDCVFLPFGSFIFLIEIMRPQKRLLLLKAVPRFPHS